MQILHWIGVVKYKSYGPRCGYRLEMKFLEMRLRNSKFKSKCILELLF